MNSCRILGRALLPTVRVAITKKLPIVPARFFGASPAHATSTTGKDDDIIIPEIVNSLEWTLETPVSVHQFDEPPIIVEIEHLDNLIVLDH